VIHGGIFPPTAHACENGSWIYLLFIARAKCVNRWFRDSRNYYGGHNLAFRERSLAIKTSSSAAKVRGHACRNMTRGCMEGIENNQMVTKLITLLVINQRVHPADAPQRSMHACL